MSLNWRASRRGVDTILQKLTNDSFLLSLLSAIFSGCASVFNYRKKRRERRGAGRERRMKGRNAHRFHVEFQRWAATGTALSHNKAASTG